MKSFQFNCTVIERYQIYSDLMYKRFGRLFCVVLYTGNSE